MKRSNYIDIPWIRVIDEELVNAHLDIADVTDSYEEAKRKFAILLQYCIELDRYMNSQETNNES